VLECRTGRYVHAAPVQLMWQRRTRNNFPGRMPGQAGARQERGGQRRGTGPRPAGRRAGDGNRDETELTHNCPGGNPGGHPRVGQGDGDLAAGPVEAVGGERSPRHARHAAPQNGEEFRTTLVLCRTRVRRGGNVRTGWIMCFRQWAVPGLNRGSSQVVLFGPVRAKDTGDARPLTLPTGDAADLMTSLLTYASGSPGTRACRSPTC
jgi:hypothetical protein